MRSPTPSPLRHRPSPWRHVHRARRANRGAALLTAMIILTLVATLATSMVWQQWRAIQIETAERSRTQSALILTGALDWARLILREDAGTGQSDNLTEPWAVPLAEARLSTFLAADRNNTDSGPEAFLSGQITDEQSKYNLANIADGDVVSPEEQRTILKLFDLIGVSQSVATQLITNIRASKIKSDSTASSMAGSPLQIQSIDELRWYGLDRETIQRLRPYVTWLPGAGHTAVNANTAPREVIAAVIGSLDISGAERLVQMRQSNPFKTLDALKKALGQDVSFDPQRINVSSSFFEVRGRLRLSDRILEERSVVQRVGRNVQPISRERINSVEDVMPGVSQ